MEFRNSRLFRSRDSHIFPAASRFGDEHTAFARVRSPSFIFMNVGERISAYSEVEFFFFFFFFFLLGKIDYRCPNVPGESSGKARIRNQAFNLKKKKKRTEILEE